MRIEEIKTLVQQSKDAQTEAENLTVNKEKQQELFRKAESLNLEAQAVQNERIAWMNRKKTAFNEKQAVELGLLRQEIMKVVKKVGEAEGYDFIFDRSGSSGAGVGILAYAKDATDLTPLLLEEINRDAPAKPDKKEGEDGPDE